MPVASASGSLLLVLSRESDILGRVLRWDLLKGNQWRGFCAGLPAHSQDLVGSLDFS